MPAARHHSQTLENLIWLRPLFPVTLAYMLGIGAGALWPEGFGFLLAAVLVAAVGMALGAWTGRPMRVLPLLFFLGAGHLAIQPWLKKDWPAGDIRHYIDQGQWHVSGTVQSVPERSDHNVRFDLEAEGLVQGSRQIAVRGKIRVTAKGENLALGRGDHVTVSGHLRDIRGFCNPGGFDYQRHMAMQAIHARLYTQAEEIQRQRQGTGWLARIDALRDHLESRISAALPNHPQASVEVLKALVLGKRAGIPPELNDAFSRTGVTHVLAISGLNIGMVATPAFWLFNYLLAWIPWLVRRAWVRRGAALLSLVPVIAYGLLAGLTPSTLRAMIMAVAFLLTYWISRRHDWLNALAVAGLIILIFEPPALLNVSFQLSFGAVLAILLGMQALPSMRVDSTQSLWRRWSLRGAAFMSVSLLATLGTAPLIIAYFNQLSLIGPLANLVVVPLAGLLVVPAGLLGMLFSPVSRLLAQICWQAAAWSLDLMIWFIQQADRFPYAAVTCVSPSAFEMVLCYLLLGVLLLWRRPKLCLAGLAIVSLAAGLDVAYWVQRRFAGEQMMVTAVDVGQGSANVLQLPGGFTVLVDGGGFGDNSSFDVGKAVLAPLLWRNKIRTIDLMILTHPNSDHLNGLLFVLKHFKVGRIWSNHEPEESQGYRQWEQLIAQGQVVHQPFEQLPHQAAYGGATVEILGPPEDFLSRRPREAWRDLNNNSMVVRVNWADISFLFTGDIQAQSEAELLERHGPDKLRSTFLIVPHHGSRSSCTQSFIDAVQPKEAIISAGWKNRFRFPHPTVLQRLESNGCRIWRTDRCGAVRITTTGSDYHIQTCRQGCPAP
jgi:competence protein ComEC